MSQLSQKYDGQKFSELIKKRALFLLKVDIRIKWLGAGMFCFALFGVLSYFPEFTEEYYSRGVFVIVRYLYDYTLGLLPFSPAIWLNLVLLMWLLNKVYKYLAFNFINKEVSIANRIKYSALSIGSVLGKLSVIFFLGWGFNYYRMPIEDHFEIELKSMNTQALIAETNLVRKQCLEARYKIEDLKPYEVFTAALLPNNLEDEMRQNLDHVMKMMGYPTPGKVRCRTIKNDYWLKSLGYNGIYVSFYGEALVSDQIPKIFIPFFIAHEMTHGYGFFDEADANFFAYLACEQSDDPAIVYAGRLALLIYLKHELQGLKLIFPNEIAIDLKANGLLSNQEEYNRMILLVNAWRKKYPLKLNKPLTEYRSNQNVRIRNPRIKENNDY